MSHPCRITRMVVLLCMISFPRFVLFSAEVWATEQSAPDNAGLDLLLLIDVSATMIEGEENQAVEVALILTRWLDTFADHGRNRVGISCFGTELEPVRGLTEVDTLLSDWEEVIQELKMCKRSDNTNLVKPLLDAENTLDLDPEAGNTQAVLIVTDGDPESPDYQSIDEHLSDLKKTTESLSEKGIQVAIWFVGEDSQRFEEYWERNGFSSIEAASELHEVLGANSWPMIIATSTPGESSTPSLSSPTGPILVLPSPGPPVPGQVSTDVITPTPASQDSGFAQGITGELLWKWAIVLICLAVLAILITMLIGRLWPTRHASAELNQSLASGDYESGAKTVKKALDRIGRTAATELLLAAVDGILAKREDSSDEAVEDPFPLSQRMEDLLAESNGESSGRRWARASAILVDLELGAIGEHAAFRRVVRDWVTALRNELGVEEDINEVNWVADNYVPTLEDTQVKRMVVDAILGRADVFDEMAYSPAKKTITSAVLSTLEDNDLDEREKWERVARYLSDLERSPALLDGIAEAFIEARASTPLALQDILLLADAWIEHEEKRIPDEPADEDPSESTFLPLIKIMSHASVCAAKSDQIMMRNLCQAFCVLFTDIAFESENVWQALTYVRRALRHSDASILDHRGPVMALFRLFSAFDPNALEASRGRIVFTADDREWFKEYPGGQRIVAILDQLEGLEVLRIAEEHTRYVKNAGTRAYKEIAQLRRTSEPKLEGETPLIIREILRVLAKAQQGVITSPSGSEDNDRTSTGG